MSIKVDLIAPEGLSDTQVVNTYQAALGIAKGYLKGTYGNGKVIIKPAKGGSVEKLKDGATQEVRVVGGAHKVVLTVQECTGVHNPSLEEEPVKVESIQTKQAKAKPTKTKPVEATPVQTDPVKAEVQEEVKAKATTLPAVKVGDHTFWGCDRRKIAEWVQGNISQIEKHGLSLNTLGKRNALRSGGVTIWTTGYLDVGEHALKYAASVYAQATGES